MAVRFGSGDNIDAVYFGNQTVDRIYSGSTQVWPVSVVQTNGWQISIPSVPAEYDPEGDPQTLSVTRSGFNSSANTTTVVDQVVLMKRIREPYPNGATLTNALVSMSDYVYSGDVVAGVTNNSTKEYPKPVCYWVNPEWEVVTDGNLTVRLFVAHAYGRNGKPVAAVKFEATDGVTTVTQTVSTLTSRSFTMAGTNAPIYQSTLDISSLNDGEITVNAIVYPYVGDAFDISAEGNAWPTKEYISVQKHYKSDGDAISLYAYVDTTLNPGVTDPVSATSATLAGAQATGYATADAAITALYAGNSNNLSGCVLVLSASQTHRFSRYDNKTVGNLPFRIVGEGSGSTRAVYTLPVASSGSADLSADRLRIENVRVVQTTASSSFFANRATDATSRTIIINSTLEKNSLTVGPFIRDIGRLDMFEVESDLPGGGSSWSTSRHAYTRLVGCRNIGNLHVISSLGTNNSWVNDGTDGAGFSPRYGLSASGGYANSVGSVFAYNIIETANGTNNIKSDGHRTGPEGIAIVGNVGVIGAAGSGGSDDNLEFYGGAPTTTDDQRPLENVICMFNTFAGASSNGPRDNKSPTDFPNTIYWQIFWRGNIVKTGGMHGDYDSSGAGGPWTKDGTQTRNWPSRFGVVWEYSTFYGMHSGTLTIGYQYTTADVRGYMTTYLPSDLSEWPGFAHDASVTGDNDHATPDYRIVDDGGTTNLIANVPRLPGNRIAYPIDLFGNVIPTDGTAVAGAVQTLA